MDRGTVRKMQFYSKNKFEKLVHLVTFIIRIHHDSRSSERQISTTFYKLCFMCNCSACRLASDERQSNWQYLMYKSTYFDDLLPLLK